MDEEEQDDDEDEIPLDMEELEAASKKARQEEELHSDHIQVRYKAVFDFLQFSEKIKRSNDYSFFFLQVLERLKANQRRDHLKGTVSGSVQATDRLMKELRDIYKSPSFKSGAYQVLNPSKLTLNPNFEPSQFSGRVS